MTQNIAKLDHILQLAPVVPVLILDNPAEAVALGRALVAGGLPVLEVTLRTPAALECMKAMTSIPGAVVGAGTVLDEDQLRAAVEVARSFSFRRAVRRSSLMRPRAAIFRFCRASPQPARRWR